MDFEMVRVREDVTLEVVLRYLRRLHELPDHTDQIFVVDRQDKLQGILPLSRLLVSEPETEVRAVMNSDFLTLNPLDSDADAAGAFERYDLVSAPVMDDQGRLIGRVTIADVVDVMREDSQEQALSRAGLQEEDIFAPCPPRCATARPGCCSISVPPPRPRSWRRSSRARSARS